MQQNKPLLIGVVAVIALSVAWIGFRALSGGRQVDKPTPAAQLVQSLQDALMEAAGGDDRYTYVMPEVRSDEESGGVETVVIGGMVRTNADLLEAQRVIEELRADLGIEDVRIEIKVQPLPGD